MQIAKIYRKHAPEYRAVTAISTNLLGNEFSGKIHLDDRLELR